MGDPDASAAEAIALAREADTARVDLVVFPELNLTSYAIDDLHGQEALHAASRAALARGGVKTLWADDDLICVGPKAALGSCLLFHAASITDPWREFQRRAQRA